MNANATKASLQAVAIAMETDAILADLQNRLRPQVLHVPFNGADLITLQRAIAAGLGDCQCEQCIRLRLIIASSLHRLQIDDLDSDRIRRLINPADRWHPRVAAAWKLLAKDSVRRDDSQGGPKP